MKAIVVHEFGDESVLRYEDVPDPVPRPRTAISRSGGTSAR